MTRPNICKEQSCNEEIKENHYLCREHWGREQKGAINECPQCGVYKDAKHPYCRECNKKANATHRPVRVDTFGKRPTEYKQKTRKYDPVRADTPPTDPEKLQTSAPPPKPPSEASSRPKIRPPGTTDLPNAYERPLKREVSLDLSTDADLPDRFIAALGELIREMKTTGTGQKRYELKEGRRGEAAGGDIFYHFSFSDKIEREDQVEIRVDQRRIEGTIVSIGAGRLVLALKKDIGNEVRSAELLIDETGLLGALKEKIEAVNKGKITLNRTLADAVVQPGALPKRPARPIRADDGSELEESQREAYQTALREALTFIWGPPGCGKTMTLSAIVRSAFNSGKRTLICSNTNKAVDQVLYKICETLTHEHPAMEGGKVVRLGRVADDKLESKYRKYVAIDEIMERHSAKLAEKKSQLEAEIAQVEARIAQIEAQTKDRASASSQRKDPQNAQLDKAKQQRDELVAEIRETEAEIAALRKTVLRDARIVGATCTKAYLTREIGQFDLVLVDEASMVSRPEVWFSAGLASERVVISGDFRQIPSIVTTEQEAIFQELGLDPFTATERTKPDAPGLIMLTTQFRMHPDICELISGPMYEDKLRTSPARKKVVGRLPPNPFERPLTIIDTSDLGPVESLDKGSRLNKLHALLVRNFVRHLRLNGVVETNHDLGICTPYSAQARHIQKLLKEDSPDNLVQCGTVHRFQGDERRIVLLEIPESGGRRAIGQFVQGVPPAHVGARLISVAVSRAQEHFVVLANLTHLDKRLPSHSLLRSILYKMEQQGRVVPGGELIERPIDSGLTDSPHQEKTLDQPPIDQESPRPAASPSKLPSEPPSPPKVPVEHRDKPGRTSISRTDELRRKLGLVDKREDSPSAPPQSVEHRGMSRQQAERLLQIAVSNPDARFRAGQWEAIDAVSNRRAKLLLVQRTGWGKSAVYFVTTRIFRDAGRGPTIIVSPLLALMRNQVEAAQRLGIRAASIDSSNRDDWDAIITDVINDQTDALLITPERLANENFRQSTLMKIADRIGLLVVDEAHCISDWGHDFRPDYRRLTNVLRMLPRNTPVLGTTATANDRVIGDIKTQLADFQIQRGPLSRHSLSLQTIRLDNQASRLAWLAQSIPQIPGSGIVYVLTKRDAEQVATWLSRHGISAQAYHAGAGHDKRRRLENMLLNNKIKVLVATTALGMGYDKPDLSFVIHYQAPSSVVAYYQQVGRAGRAIPSAVGILLAGEEDEQIHDYFRRTAFPPEHTVEKVLDALEESDGKSITELQNQLNMRQSQIAQVLKVLSVEVPSPAIKIGPKWHRTAAEFELDRERIHRLSSQRDREWQEFQEYVDTDDCFMEYLGRMLDDSAVERCGKCANCMGKPVIATAVEHSLEVEAVRFLRRSELPFEPRKSIRKGVLPTYGFPDDRLVPELQASEGRILSQWGDAGWGALVAKDKQSEHFRDELVHAVAEMVLERWQPDPPAKWVACVPSLRCPALVPDFARRLADKLKLPFCDVIQKVRDCPPQKQQENTFHQCRNLDGAFKVVGRVPTSPVLLIDDVVDSRWTMTVLSALLRRSGSGLVYPVGLATAGIGG